MKLFVPVLSLLAIVSAEKLSRPLGGSIPEAPHRIIGGQDAEEGQFPYQVSLRHIEEGHICGGFIISDKHAATAATCLFEEEVEHLSVAVDSINLNEGTVFPVIELSIYDKYDNHSFEGNVGVITIDGSFTSTRAHIIPLATEEPAAGFLAIVSGWGPSHTAGQNTEILQWVNVNIISLEDCIQSYEPKITSNDICAMTESKDACGSDIGSPLTVDGAVVGIFSWGESCMDAKLPGVYVNLAAPEIAEFLKPFIEESK